MKRYHVVWEIDVDAETPQEAAQQAREMQLDRKSTADVFDVTEFDQLEVTRVDLTEEREKREPVKVVFRKHPDGDIVALFPELSEDGSSCVSYEHVGQHGSADYAYCISRTKPAKPEEYSDLLAELKTLGYDSLKVVLSYRIAKRPNGIRRYYTIEVPEDAVRSDEEALDLAVLQIKDRQRVYRMPASWHLVWRRGSKVRVCYTVSANKGGQ